MLTVRSKNPPSCSKGNAAYTVRRASARSGKSERIRTRAAPRLTPIPSRRSLAASNLDSSSPISIAHRWGGANQLEPAQLFDDDARFVVKGGVAQRISAGRSERSRQLLQGRWRLQQPAEHG